MWIRWKRASDGLRWINLNHALHDIPQPLHSPHRTCPHHLHRHRRPGGLPAARLGPVHPFNHRNRCYRHPPRSRRQQHRLPPLTRHLSPRFPHQLHRRHARIRPSLVPPARLRIHRISPQHLLPLRPVQPLLRPPPRKPLGEETHLFPLGRLLHPAPHPLSVRRSRPRSAGPHRHQPPGHPRRYRTRPGYIRRPFHLQHPRPHHPPEEKVHHGKRHPP